MPITSTASSGADRERRKAEIALGTELSALLSATRALSERSAAAFHPGLQPAAFHLARWLHSYGPANPSALAAAVAMDRSSASALIGRMKALGLVESTPDPSDRRAVKVSLTESGHNRVAAALDLRGTEFFARTAGWPIDDIRSLTRLLHALTASP